MGIEEETFMIIIKQPGFADEKLVAVGIGQKERLMLKCLRSELQVGSSVRFTSLEVQEGNDSLL